MAIGTLIQKLRPIRIAFLVDPGDESAVQDAIKINSLLWGGTFNPIIPCYKRLPKRWASEKTRDETALSVIKGYIDGFDPDYFINLSTYDLDSIGINKEKILKKEEFSESFNVDSAPAAGVGIFEVLDRFVKDELQFKRIHPIELIRLSFQAGYTLFLSAVYGDLGDFAGKFYDDWLSEFEVNKKHVSIVDYHQFASSNYLFPRRLATEYLEPRWRGLFLFYMDAKSFLDVIDYWNLRAAGFQVVPIPKQASSEEAVKRLATDFINDGYFPYRHNKNLFHRATLLKSRGTKESELHDFAESLNLPQSEHDDAPIFNYQYWYPRIWNEWARKNAGENIIGSYSAEKETELLDGQKSFRIKALQPRFDLYYSNGGGPRFANEIDSRIYGHDELLAQAIPVGGDRLSGVVSNFSFREWRISKTGPVYLSRFAHWPIEYTPPSAESVMRAWFKEKGWDISLSPSGKIAKEMIRQLGGVFGIIKLQHEMLIKLFQDLNNKGFISEVDFKGRIARIVSNDDVWISRDQFIQNLLDQDIFKLGVQIICPTCTQKTWYSLSEVSSEVQCASCLNHYKIQSVGLDDKQWAYKATGTFGLPKQAYGAYSVLLTLFALSRDSHLKVTPLLSFEAKKENKNIEADLCLFIDEEFKDETTPELVFAECKTYNRFEKKDIDRMMALAKEFPGAVLVLATMRNQLTQKEKRMIRPLVNHGRRQWKLRRKHSPVVILTKVELFSKEGIPGCWRKENGVSREIEQSTFFPKSLAKIADASQQLHLDMQPYHKWLAEQWGPK